MRIHGVSHGSEGAVLAGDFRSLHLFGCLAAFEPVQNEAEVGLEAFVTPPALHSLDKFDGCLQGRVHFAVGEFL